VSHYYGTAELSFVAWGTCEEDLRPFPGAQLDVRGDEIWVRSPYLCDGYTGTPGPLRRDEDGFATVGDRGALEHGVLTVWGRGTDSVTTGGATVLVDDVERALRPFSRGALSVLGTPHAVLGEVVTAVLTTPSDLPAASAAARTLLPAEQRPRRWFSIEALPMTAAGKVDRRGLADLLARGGPQRLVPPRDTAAPATSGPP
jgi:acyl-CoA synthetase (AMP-forming)/AMP-acid ligase II